MRLEELNLLSRNEEVENKIKVEVNELLIDFGFKYFRSRIGLICFGRELLNSLEYNNGK